MGWQRAWRGIGREEVVNSVTHGLGVPLSLFGLVVLLWQSLHYADMGHTVAVVVYGVTLVGVYASSTLYHGAWSPRVKGVLLTIDHSCVYALIAGTYTPFMLTVMKGATGTAMLCAVWGLGAVGVLAKTALKVHTAAFSIPLFVVMGWLAVVAIKPLAMALGTGGLVLLVSGGLCYTVGIVFFLLRAAYAHAAWHVLVLAGSVLHYASVLLYARPG